jgi:hypothetical protein
MPMRTSKRSDSLPLNNSNSNNISMLKFLSVLAIAAATVMPASATPQSPDYTNGGQCAGDVYSKCRYSLEVINPDELMVLVPNLEFLGYSRISTVEHCADIVGVKDYTNLSTDSELEGMEACLVEHT